MRGASRARNLSASASAAASAAARQRDANSSGDSPGRLASFSARFTEELDVRLRTRWSFTAVLTEVNHFDVPSGASGTT